MKIFNVLASVVSAAVIGTGIGWCADKNIGLDRTAPAVLEEIDLSETDVLSPESEQEIERLQEETADLDARYWANRVLHDKDVTLAELQTYSVGWIGNGEKQYGLIEKYVRAEKVEPLTPQEHRRLDAQNEKIRKILSPGAEDDAVLSALTQKECAKLEARYWAARAKTEDWYSAGWEDDWLWPKEYYTESGDKVVNLERNIRRKKQVRKLFLTYLKQGKIVPLTKEEKKRFSACKYFDEQVHSITRYPAYRYTGE